VGDNKAVYAPEMPTNQIQDHSQLRGKSASEDEDDDEGRGRLAPLHAYVDAHARLREGSATGCRPLSASQARQRSIGATRLWQTGERSLGSKVTRSRRLS